jgi:hypothetical protein
VDTVLTVGGVSDTFTSTTAPEGTPGDDDGDAIANSFDNCTAIPNPDQRDTNGDGYGNLCDGDLNGSELVTAADWAIMRSRLNTVNADADLNGSGLVTQTDINILRGQLNRRPGPSGRRPPVAGTNPAVTLVPSTPAAVVPGSTFSVLAHIDRFPATVGATLGLSWNAAAVSVVSITPASGSPFTDVIASPPWNPFSVLIGLSAPLVKGSADAFVITFRAEATGSANIVLIDDGLDLCWTNAATFGCVTPIVYTQANVVVGSP